LLLVPDVLPEPVEVRLCIGDLEGQEKEGEEEEDEAECVIDPFVLLDTAQLLGETDPAIETPLRDERRHDQP